MKIWESYSLTDWQSDSLTVWQSTTNKLKILQSEIPSLNIPMIECLNFIKIVVMYGKILWFPWEIWHFLNTSPCSLERSSPFSNSISRRIYLFSTSFGVKVNSFFRKNLLIIFSPFEGRFTDAVDCRAHVGLFISL